MQFILHSYLNADLRANIETKSIQMKRIGLNNKTLEKIKSDQELNGIVAKAIGVSTLSMPRLLNTNNPKLTQAGALLVIREYLGVQDKDILCTVHKKSQKMQMC